MRRRRAVLPTLLLALALAGCDGSSGNGGGGDEDPDRCDRSSECPAGQVCDPAAGECVYGECADDVSCPAGQVCNAEHRCGAPCTTTAQCPTGQRCFVPDGNCYGGEPCDSSEDCPAPARSVDRVFCNDIQQACETDFAACTRATILQDCNETEYCHESGWCAPQPAFCTSETCRPDTHCNLITGHCDPDPTCDGGDCPDPVDGECRKCLCMSDGECQPDEWCDQMNTGACRGKCSGSSGCLTGEKCEGGRCVVDQGCPEGSDCTAGACTCASGLTCAARPGDDSGAQYCLKDCDPVAAVSVCPSGKRCTPLPDGNGDDTPHRGGCVDENGGGQAGDDCPGGSPPCEVDNLCHEDVCRALCDVAAPECGASAVCVDAGGIGVCVPEPTCRSDVECDPPAQICDLSVLPGSCADGCATTGCPTGQTCAANGRCELGQSCMSDSECGAPTFICIDRSCTSGCMFVGCRDPLLCNHTSGRCDHGCTVDPDCFPPDHICEGGQCVEGCGATGCTAPAVCNVTTGRCGVDTCQADGDCDPPNTVCDLEATLKCKPGCIAVGCSGNESCNLTTGRCDTLCAMDRDCAPPDTICVAGRCEDGCVGKPDPACPAGTDCDPTTGRCKPGLCTSDDHCDPPHYICDFGTSLCVHGCVYNGCGPGESCNQTTGRCY